MHSFEVSLGYESVDRTTLLPRFIENVLRSTLSYPNETSKECIQFLNNNNNIFSCQNYYFQLPKAFGNMSFC